MATIHVAVAVIINAAQQVLIARRPQHVHQGGLWEFPGGKVEPGEDVFTALRREIHEELDITIRRGEPLIRVRHDYPDKSVLLDVWQVTQFEGVPRGVEGQPIGWCSLTDLDPHQFPVANTAIIHALRMPDCMLITGRFSSLEDFTGRLSSALKSRVKLVQLRCRQYCSAESYAEIARIASVLCTQHGATLLLNNDAALAQQLNCGLHLSSSVMLQCSTRPIAANHPLSVSCHTLAELQHAEKIFADMILLSPVNATSSHPGMPGMGWQHFSDLVAQINTPVYALGGMQRDDIPLARQHGAQGIAAISALWDAE